MRRLAPPAKRVVLKNRINEWRESGTLRYNQETAHQKENHYDGREPEFFSLAHECPELPNGRQHYLISTRTAAPSAVAAAPVGVDASLNRWAAGGGKCCAL
jgi:hypothetical protein